MTELKTKSIEFKAESVKEDGFFSGYCSVFDVEDGYGDVVKKGAFTETLKQWKEKGKMPPILWQHDRKTPIGVWTELKEDDKGLYGEGKLLIDDVEKAKEAHALMKHGAIDGLSIGYRLQKWSYNEDEQVLELLAINLKEVSVVTFPANEDSTVDTVKQLISDNLYKGQLPTLSEFEKFLREAGFSKSQATTIAGHGLRKLIHGEHEEQKQQDNPHVSEALALLKQINEE